MQTKVKKWFRDKNYGFLDNGGGPDIRVNQSDLIKCQYLKVGVTVEFECHTDGRGLVAKRVNLIRQSSENKQGIRQKHTKPFRFGVMT